MENRYLDHKAFLNTMEGVLFIMLGIFCLAWQQQGVPALSIGNVAVTAKDILGVIYIVVGYCCGNWPVVHFNRPFSMEHKHHHILAA